MTYKRALGVVGALILGFGLALAVSSPAQAADGYYPASGWLVQDTTIGADVDWSDCDPGPTRADAAVSAVVDSYTVDLVGSGVAAPPHYGTSIETTNLGIDVVAGDTVSVDYELSGGASAASGAVRLFIYSAPDSDTDCTAPAASAVAPDGPTSGTLSIVVPFTGSIGTAGMVYDSSNGGVAGTVRFSNPRVGDQEVLFVRPAPEPTEPTPSTSPEPGGPEPSDTPVADGNELPTTGSGWVLPAVGVGGAFAVAGAALLLAGRRKTPTFTTE